jgi:hypothetical protein
MLLVAQIEVDILLCPRIGDTKDRNGKLDTNAGHRYAADASKKITPRLM